MSISSFLWVELVGAASLATWTLVRLPGLGPRSLGWALVCFAAGQVISTVALAAVPAALRLPHGLQIALLGIVLPLLFVMVLTAFWMLRAMIPDVGGPRGGHRVRKLAGSHA